MAMYRRRQYQRKKRNYKRTNLPWYQKKYSTQQLAYKAWNAAKYLKGLVNSELYHYDSTFNTTIPGTGSMTLLNGIAQGDTSVTRTGNSILMKNATYRFKIVINSSVTANTTVLFMLLWDTQQIADTTPAVTDVLKTAATQSLLNLNAQGRFQIVMRKTLVLTPATGARPAMEIKGFHKFHTHTKYNGANATDIQKNGLYWLMVSSESTNTPTIEGEVRVAYHDN